MPPKRIEKLEKFISESVGDGKAPNLFFVSVEGVNVLISRDFDVAYHEWLQLAMPKNKETALEDRQTGVIASVEPESDDPGARLIKIDDSRTFKFR